MAIDNVIHRIGFSRKYHNIIGGKYTCDTTIINTDTADLSADKTHEIIKI